MAKVKLSVTVQDDLLAQIQELATLQSQPLSHVVEAALARYLAAQLEADMEEGYREMAHLSGSLAEADMAAGYEVLPDA